MKSEIRADGVFQYVVGELSYDDLDKSGRISMWKLFKLVEGSRYAYTLRGSNWRDVYKTTIFLRSQYFKIFPSFYCCDFTQNMSVKFTSYMSYFGRTSYCLDTEIRLAATDALLAIASTHAVLVSRETRLPIPIPSKALEIFALKPSQSKRPLSGPEFPVRPSDCFTQKRTVMPSETDRNGHLNHALFVRYCFDCAGMAALQGKLSYFVNDIIYSNAQSVWMLYVNEAKPDEELTLFCWEDKDLNRTICVEIRRGTVVIGQCQVQFYGDGPKGTTSKTEESLTIAKL